MMMCKSSKSGMRQDSSKSLTELQTTTLKVWIPAAIWPFPNLYLVSPEDAIERKNTSEMMNPVNLIRGNFPWDNDLKAFGPLLF